MKVLSFVLCLLLVTPLSALAQIHLTEDIAPGAESSGIAPVGRSKAGELFMVARESATASALYRASAPAGALQKVTTLIENPSGTVSSFDGVFFAVPTGLPGVERTWFSDGSAEGTIPVPFSPDSIIQQQGSIVYLGGGRIYDLRVRRLQSPLNGERTVHGIVDGTPVSIETNGDVYALLSDNTWSLVGGASLYARDFQFQRHLSLRETEELFFAGERTETICEAGVCSVVYTCALYEVRPRFTEWVRLKTVELQADRGQRCISQIQQARIDGEDWWTFSVFNPLLKQPYKIAPFQFDQTLRDYPFSGKPTPNTLFDGLGFYAKDGGLVIVQDHKPLAHQRLTSEGSLVTPQHLRIVGDKLFIFGSSPERGAELWETQIDLCPSSSKVVPGTCGCGTPDTDSDRDGTPDCADLCPSDSLKVAPGACGCGTSDVDTDGDGTPNCTDQCPSDAAKTVPMTCGCSIAESDGDGDGTPDCVDHCAADPLKIAAGQCGCGVSDVDSDSDGIPDCLDRCAADSLKSAPGQCGCNIPDSDTDGDRIADCFDQCPNDPRKTWAGICGCGVREADSDGDSVKDCVDQCPSDRLKSEAGQCGCGVSEQDSDRDGTPDCIDVCAGDSRKRDPGVCGCGISDTDTDQDGVADCRDQCNGDFAKTAPGQCGCGVSEIDSDRDGAANCVDQCPSNAALVREQDGSCAPVSSGADLCPQNPEKSAPGVCGCAAPDTDRNSNQVIDCVEPNLLEVRAAPQVTVRTRRGERRLLITLPSLLGVTYEARISGRPFGTQILRSQNPTTTSRVVRGSATLMVSYRLVGRDSMQRAVFGAWSRSARVVVR